MAGEFVVTGQNGAAPFTLKLHRGDGMCLLAMNWKVGRPPDDFVGFAIDFTQPDGRHFTLTNRINFSTASGGVDPQTRPTTQSPIQKFRWVHFPRNADLDGPFQYRVRPAFMNPDDSLRFGEAQQAAVELRRETYPGQLNVTFTRGFMSSQAFVDQYLSAGPISTLLPASASDGPSFTPTHPRAKEALAWMGFEARQCILEVLDKAIADPAAKVKVVAYDLSERDVIEKLKALGPRLRIIIDDSDDHKEAGSGENQAADILSASAGAGYVKRQHMGNLQHNKTIVVESPTQQVAVCGSTNYSWRGFFVQSNNAIIVQGASAVAPFSAAFESYWSKTTTGFKRSDSTKWSSLSLPGIDAQVAFSPHGETTALLGKVAEDVLQPGTSSVLFSLAFLAQTGGPIREAMKKVVEDPNIFVYGVSDRRIGGLDLQMPNGNAAPVSPAALVGNLPAPFSQEPTGFEPSVKPTGTRMHHKFIVIDFEKPTARVYMGSYNFSRPADEDNGENLLLIKDRRIATSYMVEALRIFDHYQFRVAQQDAATAATQLALKKPPRGPGELPWWDKDYTIGFRIKDRELFA